jgi:rod shape-determining protein MreD
MKYRVLAASLLLFITALLQANLLGYVEIVNIRPLMPLVLTVAISLLRGPFESMLMGGLFGLALDMLIGKALGWHVILYMFTALFISLINEKLYREKILVLMSFAFIATLITETLYYFIIFLLRGYSSFGFMFLHIILPVSIYSSVVILPLFKPMKLLYHRLDIVDRKRNRMNERINRG